jgi:hypothetical protein
MIRRAAQLAIERVQGTNPMTRTQIFRPDSPVIARNTGDDAARDNLPEREGELDRHQYRNRLTHACPWLELPLSRGSDGFLIETEG